MRVVLLPEAQEELAAISDPLHERILNRLDVLREFPALGAPMLAPFAGWRSSVVDFFRVVYRVKVDCVEVAYIRDCRRKPRA